MDFHSGLVKITEFAPLEDYLIKKKASELFKTSSSKVITVAVNPSNLVELTKVGERFAPDSCYVGNEFKYVLSDKLIPNKEKPTHFERKAELEDGSSFDASFPRVLPLIPDMIVRQRPGIVYQPIKETSCYSYSMSQESSVLDEDKKSNSDDLQPGQMQKAVFKIQGNPTKQTENLTQGKKQGVKKVTIKQRSSKESPKASSIDKTLKNPEKFARPTQPIQSSKKKYKKKVKTILKKNKSEESNLSSNSEKKTVTWEEDEKNLQKEHDEKRTLHLDKFKYQVPSYLKEKDSNSETLNRLEKIVEEEKELLRDKGILTPESSSGSKYNKTYEELEKEIKNIREMLSEDQNQSKSKEDQEYESDEDYEEREISDYDESENHENASIDYNYSSDDCKDDKEWMKPRFK